MTYRISKDKDNRKLFRCDYMSISIDTLRGSTFTAIIDCDPIAGNLSPEIMFFRSCRTQSKDNMTNNGFNILKWTFMMLIIL